jgi:hypothetical protein
MPDGLPAGHPCARKLAKKQLLSALNHWHLRSRGPDGSYSRRSAGWEDYLVYHGRPGTGATGNGGFDSIYDPTNGTVSRGDLVRFGAQGQVIPK